MSNATTCVLSSANWSQPCTWDLDVVGSSGRGCTAGRIHLVSSFRLMVFVEKLENLITSHDKSSTMFETMLGICWCLIGQCVESSLDLCCSDDDGDDAEDISEKGVLLQSQDDDDEDDEEEELGEGKDAQNDKSNQVASINALDANQQPRDRISFSGLVIHNTSIADAVPGTLGVLGEDGTPSAPPLSAAVRSSTCMWPLHFNSSVRPSQRNNWPD